MKSHEQKIADAIASLTVRLDGWGVDDAPAKAHEFVRDMLANGWRTTKAELDAPSPSWAPGDSSAGAAACRQALGGAA